ncbi:MAG: hypothetical protein LBD15_03500, partial [Holosporales bacterium]|nr:hypothetical protein [Holosporales bacterium]
MKIFRETIDLNRYFSSENTSARRITFYAESAFYYRYFSGYIDYILKNSPYDLCYITSEASDPIFKNDNKRIKKFYAASFFPYIAKHTDARALVYTMDDLHQFAVKRSSNKNVEHIYAMHAMNSTTMSHRDGAFDYYDSVFCVGPYQKEEILLREQKYSLSHKKLVEVGYPYLDDIMKQKIINHPTNSNTVLVAPSWHEGNIFETCIIPLVQSLLMSGFKVIARPHDEMLKQRPELVSSISKRFENEKLFVFETNLGNVESVQSASLLIADWGGIVFEWAFTKECPVMLINTNMKIQN